MSCTVVEPVLEPAVGEVRGRIEAFAVNRLDQTMRSRFWERMPYPPWNRNPQVQRLISVHLLPRAARWQPLLSACPLSWP
jgi:hypothetical protein